MRLPFGSTSVRWSSSVLFWAPFIIGLIQLVPPSLNKNQVSCQEFEDLNNQQQQQQSQRRRLTNGGGNLQFAQAQQQQFQQQQFSNSRQFGGPQVAPQTSALSPSVSQSTAPISPPVTQQQQQQQQQQKQVNVQSSPPANGQRLSAASQSPFQRTNIPSRFASSSSSSTPSTAQTPNSLANPQFASSQQHPIVAAPQAAPVPSNVEQIMKNALSRAAKLEAESRQDLTAPPPSAPDTLQSRQGAQFQQQASSGSASTSKQQLETTSTESSALSADDRDASAQTTTANNHETVYSDQRFANLFARRKTLNKSKFTPVETLKAKPTLPSFIKSPPDPKQFIPSDGLEFGQASPAPRPVAAASSSNLATAARPGRLNSNNPSAPLGLQQKKNGGTTTSSTATAANNKRTNALNGKPQPVSNPKATNAKDPKLGAQTAPATSKPISNNPFSRGNGNNNGNDQANVIAMARKRLLANNALESGKLKQQQQQQQQQQKPVVTN